MKYFRVDERLIHGQVLLKWLKKTGCERLFIVDNQVAADPVIQSVLKMSVPGNVKAEFLTVIEGRTKIREDTEDIFILIKELETVCRLADAGILTESVNIGRLPYMRGKKKICDNVFIGEKEGEELMRLLDQGTKIFVQMVPDSEPVSLTREMIRGEV